MFKLFALVFLFNLYSIETQSPLCATSDGTRDAIELLFFYNPKTKSCESTVCSVFPSAHFFNKQECQSCCATKPPQLPLCPVVPVVPVKDTCSPFSVPPQQTTFAFNAAKGECVKTALVGCPISPGEYYADEQSCKNATAKC